MLAGMITDSKEKCAKITEMYSHMLKDHTKTVIAYHKDGRDLDINELLSRMPTHIAILLSFIVATEW